MQKRVRIDLLLVERGMAESRSKAQRLVMAGQVRVAGELVNKASILVEPSAAISIDQPPRYVSRGGEKLEAALRAFQIELRDAICADVGSSTGGFTDCLLQHGAARVYAIDVGKGQLHWRLRGHPRVSLIEGANARALAELPEPISLATIDVSFISLRLIFPNVAAWLAPGGQVLALVKPQFEAGKESVGRGGVVRDPVVHRAVLGTVIASAESAGLSARGAVRSPLTGPKGNREFFLWLRPGGGAAEKDDLIQQALRE
jgi:23S rRNA (cytidine1920-2'-O)/16S rRNA (cytidine1409-2'-O)-methyltransferase